LAPILISFSRRLVSDHGFAASSIAGSVQLPVQVREPTLLADAIDEDEADALDSGFRASLHS
jgi:hypothetical protein